MRLSTLFTSALALGLSSAQQSTEFTDSTTGITFQAYFDKTGYTFGVALPTNPGKDFIGVIAGKGTGWAGVSLGGSMVKKLLIAAWPNGQTMMSSFRETSNYAPPPEIAGSFAMTPIAKGTFVNSTGYQYTFLCKGCILSDGTTFAAADTSPVMGWALATSGPTAKANHSTPFNKHQSQGNYAIDLTKAKSDKYDTWAAMAGAKMERGWVA